MLQLLQQRTKLSGQIGQMKRRHGAVIYVPERERELVSRLVRLSKGKPSPRTIAAVYREIMSSSRAAQGQAPIGLLQASASLVLPASRACFGACDQFSARKTWTELASGLGSGALSLALLTKDELLAAVRVPRWRREFPGRFFVSGDFPAAAMGKVGKTKASRVFIVTPRGKEEVPPASRILILIECKSTQNAIKSLVNSMSDLPIHAETLAVRASQGLALLSASRPVEASHVLSTAKSAGFSVSILGIYPATEEYGG